MPQAFPMQGVVLHMPAAGMLPIGVPAVVSLYGAAYGQRI